jgi:hypothetical protein
MAFTATINAITPSDNGSGGIQFTVQVTFADSVSGWSTTKIYAFPITTTQTAAVNQITADGTAYKATLGTISTLQSKVGTVITI